jgi:hypothetical protein
MLEAVVAAVPSASDARPLASKSFRPNTTRVADPPKRLRGDTHHILHSGWRILSRKLEPRSLSSPAHAAHASRPHGHCRDEMPEYGSRVLQS